MNESTCTYQELKSQLSQKLENVLANFPVKREPSMAAIKAKMESVLQNLINTADDALYRPEGAVISDTKIDCIPKNPKYWLEFGNELMSRSLGSKERLLEQDYPEVIIRLLINNFFSPDEITPTSIPKILNEYKKVQINFNNIMLAREKNDFAYELQFIPKAQISIMLT